MILVMTTGFSDEPSRQANLLSTRLSENGVSNVVLDAHGLMESGMSVIQNGDAVSIECRGTICRPTAVYMMHRWRCDGIIRIPEGVTTPNAYRMQSLQFLQDVRFALGDIPWVPGCYDDVERAESKPFLLAAARRSGLVTPMFTRNAGSKDSGSLAGTYRKNLGVPFVVSYCTEERGEIGLDITGALEGDGAAVAEPGLYQWQEPIEACCQVRTYVVGDRIWAVRIARRDPLEDLRARSNTGEILPWECYELPPVASDGIRRLMKELRLSVAAPEFLVDARGRHVLIDLNPCGDWLGFFDRTTTDDIVGELSEHLTRIT